MAPLTTGRKVSQTSGTNDEVLMRDSEKWWRDRYEMLTRHGYRLRPRYRPDWIPSWIGTGKNPLLFEDYIPSGTDYVMDATRIADGRVVAIKRIKSGSRELDISLSLSPDKDTPEDSTNHCVPVLDHFSDESVSDFSFLVMPLLRWFDDPQFFTVDEVLEFIRQTLEGLVYLHERGVAHRDCAALNILFDASAMYPRGFHPVVQDMDLSSSKRAPVRRRRDSPGIKYYFIDFGISSRFPEGTSKEDRRVTGVDGLDREVPELSRYVPYDPFAVDVFILGNVYRKKLLDVFSNISFLMKLITAMTSQDPESRPSAKEALDLFHRIVAGERGIRLRWRLKEKDAGLVRNFFTDIDSVAREGVYITKKLISPDLSFLNFACANGRTRSGSPVYLLRR